MEVLSLDPDFKDSTGHSLNLHSSIRLACHKRGVDYVVAAARTTHGDFAQLAWVQPHFSENVSVPWTAWGRVVSQLFKHCTEVVELLESRTVPLQLFLANATYRQLIVLSWALWRSKPKNLVELTLLLRFSDERENGRYHPRRWLVQLLLALLARGSYRLRVATDSELLAQEFSPISPVQVETWPVPLLPSPEPMAREPLGPVRLLFAGEARMNKGFLLISQLLPSLREWLECGRLQLTVQANLRSGSPENLIAARDYVLGLDWPGLRVLPHSLSIEQYQAEIQSCDALILPYVGHEYHRQTSGPFCEGLAAGKVVVVPENTWMAHEARQLDCGLVSAPDSQSFIRAIGQLVDQFPTLQRQAMAASEDWRRIHTAQGFVEQLLRRDCSSTL